MPQLHTKLLNVLPHVLSIVGLIAFASLIHQSPAKAGTVTMTCTLSQPLKGKAPHYRQAELDLSAFSPVVLAQKITPKPCTH